jgi:YfiH family protein
VRLAPLAQHLFTTKQPQLRVGDDGIGWRLVEQSLGESAAGILRVRQVHGKAVRVVRSDAVGDEAESERPPADAVISDIPDAILAVQVADCVPMLVVDSRARVAGAIHAGWRGTCAGIAAATVHALEREFGSRPEDLHVAMGPSIGACCYEVGDELLAAFRTAPFGERVLARWFTRTAAGSLRLDVWAANRDQLVAAGVHGDKVHVSRLCTQSHAHIFESYRADGARAGRMIAAVRVPARRL